MANSDDRKSTESIVGKDVTPKVAPEPKAKGAVAPVAVKGDENQADSGSTEDKLAAAVKAQKGIDQVRVWNGGDNELYYVEMHSDGVKRLLSVTHEQAKKPTEAAKEVVAEAGF